MLDVGIRSVLHLVDRWAVGHRSVGQEALLLDVKIGRLTSGGYSVAFGKQIGMGYVRPDLAEVGTS